MAVEIDVTRSSDEPCTVESILTRHGKRLYDLAYRTCGDADLADDLLQESMIEIMRALPRFPGSSSPYTWAYKVTLRTCLCYMRDADVHTNATSALQAEDRTRSNADQMIAASPSDTPVTGRELDIDDFGSLMRFVLKKKAGVTATVSAVLFIPTLLTGSV